METLLEKQNKTFDALKEQFSYKTPMQTPRLEKVVVNVGVGKYSTDKQKIANVIEKLQVITGQKAAMRPAKKSIATFKVREGQISGYQVTLRGKRMTTFVDKLLNVVLPRTRDFRGINTTAIDEMGNYTFGIKDNSIFPEVADQDVREAFGLAITVVTSATSKDEAEAYLTHLGFPFKKKES